MGNKRVVRSSVLGSYDNDDFVTGFNEAFWITDAGGTVTGVKFAGADALFATANAAILDNSGGVVSLATDVTAEAVRSLLGISGGETPAIISEADGTIAFATGVTPAQVRELIALQDGVAVVQDGTGLVSFGTNVTPQVMKTLLEVVEPAIINMGSDIITLGPDVTIGALRALLLIPGDAAVINTAGVLSFGVDVDAAAFRTFIGVADEIISWNTYAVDSIFIMTYPDGTHEYTRRGVNIFRQVILTPTYTDIFYATRDTNTGALTDILATRGIA